MYRLRYVVFAAILLSFINNSVAQNKLSAIVDREYHAGHFNGTVMAVKNGKIVSRINRGFANFQFKVPITDKTRFPIASMTKTFTALLVLQLVEKSQLKLTDTIDKYIAELPPDCRKITINDLLLHYSGLKNEPIAAYLSRYKTPDFIRKFVARNQTQTGIAFNYNNIDYIILTQILEAVTKKKYSDLLRENIFIPLNMQDTGLIDESKIIPHLAYGYHNYTFGTGTPDSPLYNDPLLYMSNYAGAGSIYSTAEDLYKLILALKAGKLLTKATFNNYLINPQKSFYGDYLRGQPTIGFYFNNRPFSMPVLERRGSINGFNSLLLTDLKFDKSIIILMNTDTADLEKFGDELYSLIN